MTRARLAQWTLAILLTTAPLAKAVDVTTCSQVLDGDGKVVTFPARTSDGSNVRLKAILATPDQRGPSPAIVMVPGSTGLYPPYCYRAVVEDFGRRGFVVLLISPTNAVDTVGRVKLDYTFLDLVSYARSAARWLRDVSHVDSSRIGLWGHSRGGASVIFGVSDPEWDASRTFQYAIAAAPECSGNLPAPKIPLLILIGTADMRVTVEACTEYARRYARAKNLKYVLLAEAGHIFWAPSESEDEQRAAELASAAVDQFLERFE